MQKIKISVVSYLNSSPFIYGINQSDIKNEIKLSLDIPSVCADKLINGNIDVGLIPVADIFLVKNAQVISDYCISASGKVRSVMLYSDVPLNEIKTILLDYQSRTSVQLLKILSAEYWNIDPEFKNAYEGYEVNITGSTAGLVIGDRALKLKNIFKYSYDLSEAWFELTSLPFVFACWVSNKKLTDSFIESFNNALRFGVNHIDEVVSENRNEYISEVEIKKYLNENISFSLNSEKKKGMELFFNYLKKENSLQL